MSDGRDNAFARLETRINALEAEVRGLKQREQQRAQLAQSSPFVGGGDRPLAPGEGAGGSGAGGTLHLPKRDKAA